MGNWIYTLLDEDLRDVKLIDKFIELENAKANPDIEVECVGSVQLCCCLCMTLTLL